MNHLIAVSISNAVFARYLDLTVVNVSTVVMMIIDF